MASRGSLLVAAQFLLIAVVVFGGGWGLPPWSWVLNATGIALAAWAYLALGSANFSVLPFPREGNTLVRTGPYRWLRHPMYSAVLLCAGSVTAGAYHPVRLVASVLLLVVLVVKLRYEEALLLTRHPDHRERMKGTWRLVPGVW